jgi:hypothetical protein
VLFLLEYVVELRMLRIDRFQMRVICWQMIV